MDNPTTEAQLACEYVLEYHEALSKAGEGREKQMIRSTELDRLYHRMIRQVRKALRLKDVNCN